VSVEEACGTPVTLVSAIKTMRLAKGPPTRSVNDELDVEGMRSPAGRGEVVRLKRREAGRLDTSK
jgi:hypothetical protein